VEAHRFFDKSNEGRINEILKRLGIGLAKQFKNSLADVKAGKIKRVA